MTHVLTTIDERMILFDKYLDHTKMDHKQYQKDGVKWILTNELREDPVCDVRGGFIADEMGLGKTIMMIGTMLCNFLPRTLIIVPPVLLNQWYVQIARTTGHRCIIYHGDNKKQITEADLLNAKIVITTYGAISVTKKTQTLKLLHNIEWSRLIFDEAHHLRNSNTSIHFGAKLLSSKIRWLVSGTPVQNAKKDFYSLCKIINLPASFYTEADNLKLLTKSFIMKRTKKQVGIILPHIVEDKNIVHWKDDREKKLSEKIHSMLKFVNNSTNKMTCRSAHISVLLKARQSCILPRLLSKYINILKEYKDGLNSTSKIDFVIGKILQRKGNGCGKLIFCHFREEIDMIASRLKAGGIANVITIDGRTSNANRAAILADNYEALILQIQTGCEGLNLQEHYSEIYFVSPHWNPSIEDQAIARCHRIGQTKPVYIERFEMCDFDSMEEEDSISIEKYVSSIQDTKREITKSIIGNN